MPMHTIPQNVTSYEDKIVGIFVGRQFIYLAVGGLTAFILLSTGGGAAVVFRFILAIGIVAFSAAMALAKVNDRGFDVWVASYLKAILGPTEWVWSKHTSIPQTLLASDAGTMSPVKAAPISAIDRRGLNLERKEAFKHYVSGASKDLDPAEQDFLARLNFGEQLPIGANVSVSEPIAPPMLTPANPELPIRTEIATLPLESVPTPSTKPLAPLAQSSRPAFTFTIDGEQKQVAMMHNQRTNRSLSRQLLSGGVISLPVQGKTRLDLDPAYQQELTNLIGYAPAGYAPVYAEAPMMMSADAAQSPATGSTPPSSTPTDPNTSIIQPVNSEPNTTPPQSIAEDIAENTSTVRHKLIIQKEQAPAPNSATTAEASGPAGVSDSSDNGSMQQQLATFEDLAKRAQSQLEQERKAREALEAELQRIQQQGQTLSQQGQQAQQQLTSLQQTSGVSPEQLNQQQSLVEKLKQEEDRSAAFARELIQKMQQGQPSGLPLASPTPTPDAATQLAEPTISTTAMPAPLKKPAIPLDQLPTLTTQANTIHGFVFDLDGQFVEGAVVVIKDDSGEAKRALKTNKLGQFLITTPLNNGRYMVEVDKSGLKIEPLAVELTGQPIKPLMINATATAA